jgi:hypothetical protein
MSEPKKPLGRPPKAEKEINPVRQIGRWPDDQWGLIREAADNAGLSVAEWARDILLRAAKRRVK